MILMKIFRHLYAATIFSLTFAISAHAQLLDKVKVEQGILQGTSQGNIAIFKGIPFSKPPIGELRWKAPQPVDKWQGVKRVDQYAPAPMQAGEPPSGKSEDCLYLNVWTPAQTEQDKVPVLVWIYGGGFSFGASSDPVFDGIALANKGVILVSIAYRVGQLGFLAHPELSAETPNHTSGNYGLLDQIAALKWIKQNIAAFGGDPNNITIAGESAGAISVSMLAASPLTNGLFEKAISQSGGSFGPTRKQNYPGENMSTLVQAESEGLAYMKQFGAASIADLRKMSAEKFIQGGWSSPGSWPVVDGYIIPDDQYKLYLQGKFNDVPVLMGYNSDEGASFVWEKDPLKFIAGIHTRFGPFAQKLISTYNISEKAITRNARNLTRDAAFGWQTWIWAKLQSTHGKMPVYMYFFDQHPNYPKDSTQYEYGSPHGQDIAYIFKHLDISRVDVTEVDIALSEKIATYWTNFVKFGNPNEAALPNWPAFNKQQQVMIFNQQPQIGTVPNEAELKVLDQYFEWRRTSAGETWANSQ